MDETARPCLAGTVGGIKSQDKLVRGKGLVGQDPGMLNVYGVFSGHPLFLAVYVGSNKA